MMGNNNNFKSLDLTNLWIDFLQINTFQCVLATDGFMSFVIFLYADGLIQWTTGEASNGVAAQVGFNAGDGTNFFSHNDSRTDDIINIDGETYPEGHGRPGVLIFRVDGRMIDCAEDASGIMTTISHSY